MDSTLTDIIQEHTNSFKEELKATNTDEKLNYFIVKWIIEGENFFLNHIYNELEHVQQLNQQYSEIQFKFEVAQRLGIPHTNVIIMGSSKNGFSLKPNKDELAKYEFRHFRNAGFNKNVDLSSDIDLTIIDSHLFDNELENIYKHTQHYNKEYLSAHFLPEQNSFENFSRYTLRGCIKPELLPASYNWSEKFNTTTTHYQKIFDKEITIAIFKSWEYFMTYNRQNIKKIKTHIMEN